MTPKIIVEPYVVNNLVSTYMLDFHLNLAVLARKFPVNSTFPYLKLWGRVERNLTKNSISESAEIMTHIEKKFTNQCTITVKVPTNSKPVSINIKIYGNGKIVMTGCRDLEIALQAVKMITNEFNQIETEPLFYQITTCYLFQHLEDFWRQKTKIHSGNKAFFVRVKKKLVDQSKALIRVAEFFVGSIPETRSVSSEDESSASGSGISVLEALINSVHQADLESLNQLLWSQPNQLNLRWLKAYEILCLYYSMETIETLELAQTPVIMLIQKQLFDFTQTEIKLPFPLTYSSDRRRPISREFLTTRNYNTGFNSNLNLNLKITECYLNQRSQFRAEYNPTSKPAIKAYYFTAVDCQLHSEAIIENKDPKCQCKKVSCLIFRERKVIMNGARTLKQADDTHRALKDFFQTHGPIISYSMFDPNAIVEIPNDQLPDLIRRKSDGQIFIKRVYLTES